MRYLFLCLLCWGAGSAWAAGGDTLTTAIAQVEQAIAQGETSLGPHEPGSGWTKRHMQEVVGLIEGSGGAGAGGGGARGRSRGGGGRGAAAAGGAARAELQ